jgi:hypothetical protein
LHKSSSISRFLKLINLPKFKYFVSNVETTTCTVDIFKRSGGKERGACVCVCGCGCGVTKKCKLPISTSFANWMLSDHDTLNIQSLHKIMNLYRLHMVYVQRFIMLIVERKYQCCHTRAKGLQVLDFTIDHDHNTL